MRRKGNTMTLKCMKVCSISINNEKFLCKIILRFPFSSIRLKKIKPHLINYSSNQLWGNK